MGESLDEALVQRLKNALEKNQARYTALLEQKKMIERSTGIKH
jgi:hypothetical protein